MQPPPQSRTSNQSRSRAWALASWTAKMDNNLVSALINAVKGLLPYAQKERDNLTKVAHQGAEKTHADDAISFATAVVEVAQTTIEPSIEVLERMHGLDLPAWVYFSPHRAAHDLPCYWSSLGEWADFSQAITPVVRKGVEVPPDGVWIPHKTAAENTCYRAAVHPTPGSPVEEHFVWAVSPNKAREKLAKTFDQEHQVTILRAVA